MSTGSSAAERTVSAVFLAADTNVNVQGVRMGVDMAGTNRREPGRAGPAPVPGSAPRRRGPVAGGDTGCMKLSRSVSWFLLAFGVWSWFIWVTFVKNLWKDGSGLAFDDAGDPTAYFWVHLLLAVTSFLLGTAVGVIGFRGVRALRRERSQG
ncbi:hypothetical protein GCM10010353_62570 [Streptomyces chryseus]|nr:hypothetical protein GCM10010353_62570 [Streptomyces chryseus]